MRVHVVHAHPVETSFNRSLFTAVVASHVFGPGRVTVHRVRGAILVYLNVASLFAITYGLLVAHDPTAIIQTTGGVIDNPDIEILRDDLVTLLRGSLSDDVEFIFGDSITGLDDRGDVVTDTAFRAYVERTQRLVDLDEGMNGDPIAPDDFYDVVHSIQPKDY